MNRICAVMAVLALLSLSLAASADVFNLGTGYTNLETVAVGDAGNAGDTRYRYYGGVNYAYKIGKYEVTAAQYTDFLNSKAKSDQYGLYNTSMADVANSYGCNIQRNGSSGSYTYSVLLDWANMPVNYVSIWDACRFNNWLHNGQGNGDTETGAYTLAGFNGDKSITIKRNADAKWFVPSENEWYKAAYYKGGGANAGYWEYPTQSNSIPSNDLVDIDTGNNANFKQDGYAIGGPYYRTNVGEFENSESAYGTFDQGGNVWERNEASGTFSGLNGSSFEYSSYCLRAQNRYITFPTSESSDMGFRVAAAVPEPSSFIALLGGLLSLLGIRRRRA